MVADGRFSQGRLLICGPATSISHPTCPVAAATLALVVHTSRKFVRENLRVIREFLTYFLKDTAFKQQRLKAWQPILTPRTVLPTFFLIGLVFLPLGIGLLTVSNGVWQMASLIESHRQVHWIDKWIFILQVSQLSFDYTNCPTLASSSFSSPPDSAGSSITAWAYNNDTQTCNIQFTVPTTFKAPVFLYYRLTNFYQNHRRYVKSFSANQLLGSAESASSISSDCSPLDVNPANNLIYYPCGLIANSLFSGFINSNFDRIRCYWLALRRLLHLKYNDEPWGFKRFYMEFGLNLLADGFCEVCKNIVRSQNDQCANELGRADVSKCDVEFDLGCLWHSLWSIARSTFSSSQLIHESGCSLSGDV